MHQRYGVSGGLTSEPKIIEIRNGLKITHTVTSLKFFNKDFNTLEVFTYAHDKVENLSGQLLMDTACRLPGTSKRRYLDYLDKSRFDLNHPKFESLRNFVVHELGVMTSDYAQVFFKNDERDKSREIFSARNAVGVRQVATSADDEV